VAVPSIVEAELEKLVNRANYRLVKDFLNHLAEVEQVSPASLDRYWFYLRHLLLWAMDILFNKADRIRPAFPIYVAALPSPRGGLLAQVTQKKIIEIARQFFQWAMIHHAGEFRHLPSSWIETLRPGRQASTFSEHIFVTVEDVLGLCSVPREPGDLALWRDQAAAATLFLTGMRASAFTTLPIQAVDFAGNSVKQWPELGVKTKNGKRATTFMLPIPELKGIAQEWDDFVRGRLPVAAPWYAPVESQWGDQRLSLHDPGENRNQAINRRLRLLFSQAELPYRSAHKFRHGHAVYGLQHARTIADYKAVSMNLMHEDIKITDQIYAPMLASEVQQRIAGLTVHSEEHPGDELVTYINRLSNADLSKVMMVIAKRLAE